MAARLRVVLVLSLACASAGAVAACDDLNRPAYVPKSEVRKQCFSDVECPGSRCIKPSGNDIQGHCATAADADGGSAASEGGAPAPSSTTPLPVVQPQPGDIQI